MFTAVLGKDDEGSGKLDWTRDFFFFFSLSSAFFQKYNLIQSRILAKTEEILQSGYANLVELITLHYIVLVEMLSSEKSHWDLRGLGAVLVTEAVICPDPKMLVSKLRTQSFF